MRQFKNRLPSVFVKRHGLVSYAKPFQSPKNLIARLQTNGLIVNNIPQAESFLESINYYRFKVYLRVYLIPPEFEKFIIGSDYDDAVQLYSFDEELRAFVFNLTTKIEIQLKHRLDQHLAIFTKNPFWYLDPKAYKALPKKTLNILERTLLKSKEEFAKHYSSKYHNGVGGRYNFLPPFWIASELLTIGQVDFLIKALDKNFFFPPSSVKPQPNQLDLLALDFGAFNIGQFSKWVEYVRNLRNICAHNSRLWNRHLATPPNINRYMDKSIAVPSQHRLYHNLVMLRVILKAIREPDGIKDKMTALFAKYPVAQKEMSRMGFPIQWAQDTFW